MRLRNLLPRRALVALGLSLAFVASAAAPASADASSERARPGVSTWQPQSMTTKIEYDRFVPNQGQAYKATWTLTMPCYDHGSLATLGDVSPGSYRGLEFDLSVPNTVINDYWTASDDVTQISSIGFSGNEGLYLDTNFLDNGGTEHLGWGVSNAENLVRCAANGAPKQYTVSIWLIGTVSPPSGKTIVWRSHAMHEESSFCGGGIEFCMFGDFDHTDGKALFRVSGADELGNTNPTSAGYLYNYGQWGNYFPTNQVGELYNVWSYNIPDHGIYCSTPVCYNSGYYTGGDLTTASGPPGDDAAGTSLVFGDIEGNNTVSMTADAPAPGGSWTASQNKKASATAEATLKCNQPTTGQSSCYVLLGYTGLADSGNPAESRLVGYTLPADGNWYVCRVDDNHMGGQTPDFKYAHSTYEWTVATSSRWVAVDNAYLGPKTVYASNESPVSDMYAVPGCTNIGY